MRRGSKGTLIVLFALLVAVLLYRVRGVLVPFSLAAILAYVSNPLVTAVEKRAVPRSLAIVIVYAVYGVLLVLLYYTFVPALSQELQDVLRALPRETNRLEGMTEGAVRDLKRLSRPWMAGDVMDTLLIRIRALFELFATRLAELILGLFSRMLSLVIAPFLAFFMLRDLELAGRRFVAWIPSEYRSDVLGIARQIDRVVGRYIRGQLIISAFVGVSTTVGLIFLQVKFAVLVGVLVGLADVIPYFGPFVGAVPAVTLALLKSPATALWVIVLLVVVNQIEGSLIGPQVIGESVGLHPLTVIFAILVGSELAGVFGMLLAVPVAATVKVVVNYVGERLMVS